MEGCKLATATFVMVVLVALAGSRVVAATVKDFGAPAPSPMESAAGGVALSTPVALLGAMASLVVAWLL